MDAAPLLELLGRLDARGLRVWLDGGWAIDALLGRQRRPHDDVDLVAPLHAAAAIQDALAELGYRLAGGGAPESFELVDAVGRQVDVHPFTTNARGDGLYRMADGEHWVYPASGFAGVGEIDGRAVACLTPEVVMLGHATGYALDKAHRDDVAALSRRYGIPVPPIVVAAEPN
jgi:lincosamide nucleotidyltransferase A/C/D/E